MNSSLLRKYVPKALRRNLTLGRHWLLDSVAQVAQALGRRDESIPPRRLVFVGSGDFQKVGKEFLDYFRELGGLEPDHRVLDVGCGIGRMALALTGYLSDRGRYDGFDVVPHGIKWCRKHITSRYPQFDFQLADIRNREFNPHGRVDAAEYRFPYADSSFDFVFLASVFTHMLPREVDHYLSEIARVLKPSGRCLITRFLLNPESKQMMDEHRSELDFAHVVGDCLTTNPVTPEEAIAYREEQALSLYQKNQLILEQPIHYGFWCGRATYLSFQDICVAHKPGNNLALRPNSATETDA